jgi:hypothetical protein
MRDKTLSPMKTMKTMKTIKTTIKNHSAVFSLVLSALLCLTVAQSPAEAQARRWREGQQESNVVNCDSLQGKVFSSRSRFYSKFCGSTECFYPLQIKFLTKDVLDTPEWVDGAIKKYHSSGLKYTCDPLQGKISVPVLSKNIGFYNSAKGTLIFGGVWFELSQGPEDR